MHNSKRLHIASTFRTNLSSITHFAQDLVTYVEVPQVALRALGPALQVAAPPTRALKLKMVADAHFDKHSGGQHLVRRSEKSHNGA